jgi:predicted amidohydrolase
MELTEAQIADLSRFEEPILVFVNLYALCAHRCTDIVNLLRTRRFNYEERTDDLLRTLDSGRSPHLSWDGDDQVLLDGATLIDALSRHIAKRYGSGLKHRAEPYFTSDSFGTFPFWLAKKEPSPLTAHIHDIPRDQDQLHQTFQRFHRELLVTPGSVGEWTLTRIAASRALESFLEQRMLGPEFRVAVSSLSQDAEISGESRPRSLLPPHEFHVTSTGPVERQTDALRHVLELAYERRAAILVLPELRVPPPLLEATREFLTRQAITAERGILMVAAGSWHVDMPDGRRFNRCVLLGHDGRDLWSHDKLREYEITPQNVAASPGAYRAIGVGPAGAVEAIHRGKTLEFCDSIIGRVAAAICVGFFSPDVRPLLLASGVNLFLVPAMTDSIAVIEACAADLVHTQHAYTLASNCGCVGREAPSFCMWPVARDNIRRLDPSRLLLTLDLKDTSMYDID